MNIYIYGTESFKKEIHSTLEHANIKFKLDNDTLIKELDELEELKEIIKNNPNDIYLIDDEKIIKKNTKIKFLIPKDGIEEEFLLDNGIADLSVDSLKEIPIYILRKFEEQKVVEDDIQNSIIDIVDEAYEKEEVEDNFELDEELSSLLEKEEVKQDINLDDLSSLIEDAKEEETEALTKFEGFDDVELKNSTFDYDDKSLIVNESEKEDIEEKISELEDVFNPKIEQIETVVQEEKTVQAQQGEKMNDGFSELDSLTEQEVLAAINGEEISNNQIVQLANNQSNNNEKIEIQSSNAQDISEIINRLLNNKTLEITIKVKD